MLSEWQGQQSEVRWRHDEEKERIWHDDMAHAKMATSRTSFKPRIGDSSTLEWDSRGLVAGWGFYRLDELVYSGEVKRQPKMGTAELTLSGWVGAGGGGEGRRLGGCRSKGHLLLRPSLLWASAPVPYPQMWWGEWCCCCCCCGGCEAAFLSPHWLRGPR